MLPMCGFPVSFALSKLQPGPISRDERNFASKILACNCAGAREKPRGRLFWSSLRSAMRKGAHAVKDRLEVLDAIGEPNAKCGRLLKSTLRHVQRCPFFRNSQLRFPTNGQVGG